MITLIDYFCFQLGFLSLLQIALGVDPVIKLITMLVTFYTRHKSYNELSCNCSQYDKGCVKGTRRRPNLVSYKEGSDLTYQLPL